ncbi:hypothetical protein RHO15_09690 [Utexia brackfieldae]|uniref:hypothetical protein n=1 Tax=Utexia brackfieldae TaxID=3074108 RepID=UPI00370D48F4
MIDSIIWWCGICFMIFSVLFLTAGIAILIGRNIVPYYYMLDSELGRIRSARMDIEAEKQKIEELNHQQKEQQDD